MIQDWFTPSQKWELALYRPTLSTGTWIIAVVGTKDERFSYTLSANLYDCPRNCSGHGWCNVTRHACSCQPGWGNSDCSLYQGALTPFLWTIQTIGANSYGYFIANVSQDYANKKIDMLILEDGGDSPATYPRVYIAFNRMPNSNNYDIASPLPSTQQYVIRVPHNDVQPGVWYIAVSNLAAASLTINIQLAWEGDCILDCSGHGNCNLSVCECSDGWSGSGCEVASSGGSSEEGVETGTIVALVIVFLLLGVALGIVVKRQFPGLCAKGDPTLQEAHRVNYSALGDEKNTTHY